MGYVMSEATHVPGSSNAADFAATRWTMVLSAARGSKTPRAAAAIRAQAQKRGGAMRIVPLEGVEPENRYRLETCTHHAPP